MYNEFEKKDLTKRLLSDVFETAAYSNPAVSFLIKKETLEQLGIDEEFHCDNCAETLLRGGTVYYLDNYANDDDTIEDSVSNYDNCEIHNEYVVYSLTLDEAVKHLNDARDDKAAHVFDLYNELADEEGDMFTAWNFAQVMFFGDIVYG